MHIERAEGMVRDSPECAIFRSLRVDPEMLLPERIGAGKQGVFKHIDGCGELLPQSRMQCRLHWLFSHNISSFLFLFSMLQPKAVRIFPHIENFIFQRDVLARFECALVNPNTALVTLA